MVTIQYITLEQCTQGWSQDWSQARTFAGASMFICGSWVELSSDARAKQGTVCFLSFLSPRLIAASLRRRNDHLIMILVKKGSVLGFFFYIVAVFKVLCLVILCVYLVISFMKVPRNLSSKAGQSEMRGFLWIPRKSSYRRDTGIAQWMPV